MSEAPQFSTFEELQEWLDAQISEPSNSGQKPSEHSGGLQKKVAKKTSTKKKTKKKTTKKDEGVELSGGKIERSVWASMHFYVLPGDSINKVRLDAREEVARRNVNVRVYYHDHFFGEECNTRCGQA